MRPRDPAPKPCTRCSGEFTPMVNGQKYCDPCRFSPKMHRCMTCRNTYTPDHRTQRRCTPCTEESPPILTVMIEKSAAKKRAKWHAGRNVVPCSVCLHGRASTASDIGWECAMQWAGTCKPLSLTPGKWVAA